MRGKLLLLGVLASVAFPPVAFAASDGSAFRAHCLATYDKRQFKDLPIGEDAGRVRICTCTTDGYEAALTQEEMDLFTRMTIDHVPDSEAQAQAAPGFETMVEKIGPIARACIAELFGPPPGEDTAKDQ